MNSNKYPGKSGASIDFIEFGQRTSRYASGCYNNSDYLWTLLGSNQRPSDYESDALTV